MTLPTAILFDLDDTILAGAVILLPPTKTPPAQSES